MHGKIPVTAELSAIAMVSLKRDVLCLDCDTVSNAVHQCPSCAGHNLQALAPVLDRVAA